ncbi:MAG: hypothetical protein NTY04_01170 [Candidatus Staskawiczbacteria bacterium]|nr:hypothetical protein [Candidatus Staskawiczbacteria bacterium]
MNEFIKQNWFKIIIALVLIIVAVSISYYFVVIPQKEQAIAQQQKQEADYRASQQKILLDDCLSQAENKKNTTIIYWGNFKDKNCTPDLSASLMNHCLDNVLREFDKADSQEVQDRNDCYKQHPQ